MRTSPLPRSTPEAEGVPSAAILAFVDRLEAESPGVHGFMLLRHGSVIAEGFWSPFAADMPHMLFSVSKSFTSTAIGLAVAEGLLTVDDRVIDLLPDDVPDEISPNLEALRVRHLLSMSTGHATDTMDGTERSDGNWAKAILARPIVHLPGTTFVYNTGATYLLSAILQRLTGQRLVDYLTPRLFEPLGIEGAEWEQSPDGIDTGGFGLAVTLEDVAALGQLYLQHGEYAGRQILPAEWVQAATSVQIGNEGTSDNADWQQGYGFQFWMCRNGAYRGDGAFGQFCVVLPEQDAVLVMFAGLPDMQAELDAFWDTVLPAFASDALEVEADDRKALATRLEALSQTLPEGELASSQAERIDGIRFDVGDNGVGITGIALARGDQHRELTIWRGEQSDTIAVGSEAWIPGMATIDGFTLPVVTAGAWPESSVYVAELYFLGTPFVLRLTLTFDKQDLTLDIAQNVNFGPARVFHVEGHPHVATAGA